MNDQTSTHEQLTKLVDLANKNGLYDAADWVLSLTKQRKGFKYYKHAGLGVVGTPVNHEDGEYTLLTGHTRQFSWIRTADLHSTRAEAAAAPVATFAEQTP